MIGSRVKLMSGFFVFMAVGVLLIPFPWFAAWVFAAAVHELCHILCLHLCGYQILSVEIGLSGAKIETDAQSGFGMVACAMAGPVGGLLLFALIHVCPRIALCGLIQSLYNLLPVYPLDGGRAAVGTFHLLFPKKCAEIITYVLENTVLASLCAAAIYASVRLHLGLWPLAIILMLFVKNKKIPCKQSRLRVQ